MYRRGIGKGESSFMGYLQWLSVLKENSWENPISVLRLKVVLSLCSCRTSSKRACDVKKATRLPCWGALDVRSALSSPTQRGDFTSVLEVAWHSTFPISCHLKGGLWNSGSSQSPGKQEKAVFSLQVSCPGYKFSGSDFGSPRNKCHLFLALLTKSS